MLMVSAFHFLQVIALVTCYVYGRLALGKSFLQAQAHSSSPTQCTQSPNHHLPPASFLVQPLSWRHQRPPGIAASPSAAPSPFSPHITLFRIPPDSASSSAAVLPPSSSDPQATSISSNLFHDVSTCCPLSAYRPPPIRPVRSFVNPTTPQTPDAIMGQSTQTHLARFLTSLSLARWDVDQQTGDPYLRRGTWC